MKVLWYLLTFVLGAFGVLALIRFIELLLSGGGISPIQLFIALVCLVLARKCIVQARRAA